jgi:Tfp pilus assembly protein PilF
MNFRYLTAASLMALTLSTGCVRRVTTQDFGLSGFTPAKPKRQATPSPDASLRAVFKSQTQGAFNPLSDDQRVVALQAKLKTNPNDVASRLELGGIYESYRLEDQAFDVYREAIVNSPSKLGRDASPEGRARQGEASREASGEVPLGTTPAPLFGLRPVGLALRGATPPDSGRELIQQAVIGLSRSARGSHRTAEAVPVLEAILKDRPTTASLNELGLLYQELRNFGASERAFREGIARSPDSDTAHNNLGYNLVLQNKTEEAEREFRKALEAKPASVTARNNLGSLLAHRGDLQGALEQFEMVSDAATAHNNLAVVLLEMQQYEKSRDELVKALAMRRSFAPALANFKLVQDRMREQAEVQKYGRLPLSVVRVPTAVIALEDVGQKDFEGRK